MDKKKFVCETVKESIVAVAGSKPDILKNEADLNDILENLIKQLPLAYDKIFQEN